MSNFETSLGSCHVNACVPVYLHLLDNTIDIHLHKMKPKIGLEVTLPQALYHANDVVLRSEYREFGKSLKSRTPRVMIVRLHM